MKNCDLARGHEHVARELHDLRAEALARLGPADGLVLQPDLHAARKLKRASCSTNGVARISPFAITIPVFTA